MLPMRVRVAQALRSLSDNPAIGPRLLSLAMVIAVMAGIAASGGLSINIQIGTGEAVPGSQVASTTGSGGGTTSSGSSGPGGSELGPVGGEDGGGGGAGDGGSVSSSGGSSVASAGADAQPEEPQDAGGAEGADAPAVAAEQDRCQGAQLGNTDHGVTAEEIEIALMTVDLARFDQLGFGISSGEVDYPKIMDAWMNHLNATGGVACRKVTYYHEESDLSVDAQIASCKEMTQDRKVFAVLSPGGNVAGAPCITKDNKTPMPTALAAPERWARQGAPYLWDMLQSQERIMRNHVRWLVEAGEITTGSGPTDDGTFVGVVYVNEPYGGPSVEGAMIPEFKKHGFDPKVAELPRSLEQAAAQMCQVVVDFNTSGVEHVVMPMSLIHKTQFMQCAQEQDYFPTYTENEATVGCQDFTTSNYPAESWDRTKCVSTGLIDGAPNGLTPEALQGYLDGDPFAQLADRVYLETNPEGYDNGGESDQEDTEAQQHAHYLVGSLIKMWEQAADRVDPENLTRAAWGAAMEGTGEFHETVSPNPYTYGPEKWSGPDHIEIVQWHAEASNGKEARTYHELRPFFQSWY